MTVNQAYWWLMSFMVMLLGFILMLGNLYSYPGSLFWGEAWIYAGATLFAGGAISWIVIDAATFAVKGE